MALPEGVTWGMIAYGLAMVGVWFFITLVIHPYFVERKLRTSVEQGKYNKLLTKMLIDMMFAEAPVEVEVNGEKVIKQVSLFEQLLAESFTFFWGRAQYVLNGNKGAMSKRIQKMANEQGWDPRLLQAAGNIIPEKFQWLIDYGPDFINALTDGGKKKKDPGNTFM